MANPNNWKQYSEPKPEFTDYIIAGTDAGRENAAKLRADYETRRNLIQLSKVFKLIGRPDRISSQSAKRLGFPKKRERDEDIPSKRGVPHSGFLKQFKIVEKLVSTGFGDWVWVAKVYVLHATRGWKLYA